MRYSPKLAFIVAMSQNHVIGKNNQIPWHLPDDLADFKAKTLNHPVLMGRKTYQSIGRALPQRANLVLTQQKNWQDTNVSVYHNVKDLLAAGKQAALEMDASQYFVIGGATLFEQTLRFADVLYINHVQAQFTGDVYFPALDMRQWTLTAENWLRKDTKNAYDVRACVYARKTS